ncbi:putative exported protein [Vairimorpha necatrix]|uniref:Exported protein n=1 Tax=Vairimorpha necatrix TaxID=6039 RepID=A0AAX4JBD3_9MICR
MNYLLYFLLIFTKNELNRKHSKLKLKLNGRYKNTSFLKEVNRTQRIKRDIKDGNKIILTKGELDDIFLSENALCAIFKNLELLKTSDKLKDVFLDKVAIYRNNKDPWNKLEFNGTVDSTGYFHGVFTDKFVLKESMFFHIENLNEETNKRNVMNIKKILYYISILKKKTLHEIFKEECQLDMIDLIIFKNVYKYKTDDNVKVCICRDIECTICEGVYETKKSVL